jgi:hypothetical protein
MFDPTEEVLTVIREWVHKAENDVTTAAHTLTPRRHCPADTLQGCAQEFG